MDDLSCGGDKYRLVELFYAYLLPLPQRKYRPNRRGKALTKSQIKLRKQSGSHHVSFDGSTQTRIISQPAKRLVLISTGKVHLEWLRVSCCWT